MAAESTTIVTEPTGKTAGTTTKAAAAGGAVGAGVAGGPVAAILVYIAGLMGVDLKPIEWALAAVLGALGAWVTAHEVGKRTPTDQVRERESVLVQQVDATDPELKEAVVSIASAAGLIPGQATEGAGAHRATGSSAVRPVSATLGPLPGDPGTSGPAGAAEPADDDLTPPAPIVQPVHVEIPDDEKDDHL